MIETLHIAKNEENLALLLSWQLLIMEDKEEFGVLEIDNEQAESIKIKVEADKIEKLLVSLYLWTEEKQAPKWHIEKDED